MAKITAFIATFKSWPPKRRLALVIAAVVVLVLILVFWEYVRLLVATLIIGGILLADHVQTRQIRADAAVNARLNELYNCAGRILVDAFSNKAIADRMQLISPRFFDTSRFEYLYSIGEAWVGSFTVFRDRNASPPTEDELEVFRKLLTISLERELCDRFCINEPKVYGTLPVICIADVTVVGDQLSALVVLIPSEKAATDVLNSPLLFARSNYEQDVDTEDDYE